MEHKKIKLPVSNDKIEKYKVFYGIYSDGIAAKDKKTRTSKRIYATEKQNYVYYQRAGISTGTPGALMQIESSPSISLRQSLISYLKYPQT